MFQWVLSTPLQFGYRVEPSVTKLNQLLDQMMKFIKHDCVYFLQ